jgi:hypothetical protein
MSKEASVIRDMSSLPNEEQVQFWYEEFVPLLAQEHALRERTGISGTADLFGTDRAIRRDHRQVQQKRVCADWPTTRKCAQ